jgi:hypothetical protein
MNIFALDEDPEMAAQYHCDKHVPKMLLEAAQILSTSAYLNDSHKPGEMYKPVPSHNPDIHEWVAESQANFVWTLKLAKGLHTEYKHRFGKDHKSYRKVIRHIDITEIRLPKEGLTERPQCMPNRFKVEGDAIEAYREYYKFGKDWEMSWFNREVPPWFDIDRKVKEL